MSWEIRQGDVLDRLQEMPDESINCVVTSPPYWNLRDYGTGIWEGGTDPACDHLQINDTRDPAITKQTQNAGTSKIGFREICGKCGARRTDEQIGMEATPEEYVSHLVAVFHEVRRVLTKDGICWLNLGDSYAGSGKGAEGGVNKGYDFRHMEHKVKPYKGNGVKPKDLVGIPWRVALALQADGWWIRSDVIWNKPNPMPESVSDRPTKAHEYIFLLTKSENYWYDQDAIREPNSRDWSKETHTAVIKNGDRLDGGELQGGMNPAGRNARSVWTMPLEPWGGGMCAACTSFYIPRDFVKLRGGTKPRCAECESLNWRPTGSGFLCQDCETLYSPSQYKKLPKAPRCRCGRDDAWVSHFAMFPTDLARRCILAGCPKDGTVLDPFSGCGTTVMVSLRYDRNAIGIELRPEYVEMSRRRIESDAPLFNLLGGQ